MDAVFKVLTTVLLVLSVHGMVSANIIVNLTESSAMGTYREDVNGDPITRDFSGSQISESFGNVDFGSASIWDSVSDLAGDKIFFQNGNASFGRQVTSSSRTVVDISFENTGSSSVRPTLNSQITPAGLGIYVSGCEASELRNCELRNDGDYDWQDAGETAPEGEAFVGTRFDFRVVSGSEVLYELTGGLSLVKGIGGAPTTVVEDFGDASLRLNNFRQTSPVDSQQQISFDWDATDFLVEFPASLTLAPGEIGTVTYITEVTTFSNAFCFGQTRQACPIAYGSFGDPIGRGGASNTRGVNFVSRMLARANITQNTADPGIDGIDVGLFEFSLPTFENGEFSYRAISGPGITASVSEPGSASIALLVLSMAFFNMRRHRRLLS